MSFAILFISDNHTLICWIFSTSIICVLNNFQIMNNLCYRFSITCNSGMHVCTLSTQKKIGQHLKFRIPTAQIPGPPCRRYCTSFSFTLIHWFHLVLVPFVLFLNSDIEWLFEYLVHPFVRVIKTIKRRNE